MAVLSVSPLHFSLPAARRGGEGKAILIARGLCFDAFRVLEQSDPGMVKVSVIGIGMRSHAGVASSAFQALADKGINIRAITTSEIKISNLIDQDYTELAVRTLHSAYGLDKE